MVALVLLLLANTLRAPDFLAVEVRDGALYGAPINILRNGSSLLLVSLGLTLVIATRGIDLSVGAVIAISGAVSTAWIAGSPDPGSPATVLVAVLLAIVLCGVLGAWNGFLVSVLGIQPIIATLVLLTAGRGVAMLITGGMITTVTSPPFRQIGGGHLLGVPVPVVIAAVVLVVLIVLTRRTALGVLIESVGINPSSSRLAGVRARGLVWTVYVISAVLAGIAGLIIASTTMAADANNAGLFIELDAILAVVIGGTLLSGGRFSLMGTVVGVLVIQTLTLSVTVLGIPPSVTPLFKAVVVIVVVLAQSPKGRTLLAARRRRRPAAAAPATAGAPGATTQKETVSR
ncbi:ABC transporter permease [Aquipuribacter sp. SD81]|uniref:ABC transporter permease n=1 Tax=Aquipuribacter sp. SD81 TaxID=3127703 RepID=UPI003FA54BDC